MSLFNSGPGQPFSSNYSSSMNFGNPFNRANTSNTGMSNPFPGSSLSGPGSLFPASGSNNLFGNTNTGGGGTGNSIWGNNNNSTNANSNLFRSNTMPQNMFGSGSNTSNLFSANTTNTAFPRSNSMLNTGSNFMGTSNSGMSSNSFFNQTSHGYGTRGTATIDKGSIGHKHNPSKTHEGIYVYSITHDKAFSRKCLDEIRAEDYAFMKAGQVPEGVQKMILANKQAVESGTMGMGSNQGVMVGSSSNNLFGNNTNTMGGMGGSMGMNTNNPFANTMQKPNNWFSGGNTNNNLFQNTNNSMMNSSGSFSFSGGMQNSNSNMSGNNLFAQNSGPNFFNNNQNQGNFMNQQNTSASNMFAGGNKFQSNSGFPQSGGNNLFTQSTGANNNLFQNRQNSVFPTGNMPLNNNNLFNPNRNPPPSLFPNQTQPNNPLFPQQNQSAGGHQQLTFMNQPPNTGSGANPHLFPPQGNFPGAFTGFPQQQQGFPQFPGFYPQGQQGFVDGMNPNPSLFPPQPGQMGFQQGPFQQYPSMQHNMHDVSWNGMGYQTNAYTPYQPYQEEKQTYTPRQTLTEAILSLDKKMTDDEKGSPRPGFTYFPYNPFEKKHRKADISEKENIRNTSLLRPGGNSLIRRDNDEDAFSLIKKSRYVEDDVEIIMRPKLFLPTGNRNRSTSPASSRSRDYSGERTGRGMSRNIYNDSVNVTVNVMLGNDMKKSMEIRIYRQSSILALKVKILEKLRESNDLRHESTVSLEELANKCAMFTDSKMLRDVMILSAVGIVDGSNVCLQVDEEHVNEELKEENRRRRMAEETQIPSSSGGRTSLVSRHVPKLTKEGYYCIPSIEEMSRMSDKELTMIEGFIVGNAHGKVEFEGRTDVRDLDLDDIVVINPRAVEVYPEERYPTEDRKPIKGEKLNKPAMITLFDCFFKNKGNGEDVRKKFAEKATRDGFEFIDYDSKNGVYRLRIPHF